MSTMTYSVGSTGYSGDFNTKAHGSGRFMTPEEGVALQMFDHMPEKGSILIGRSQGGDFAFLNRPGHVVTVAPARSGKGTGVIIPNLVTYTRGSVVVTDPRGENCAVTYAYRKSLGQNVIVLDPAKKLASYGIGEGEIRLATFNPLDDLNHSDIAQVLDDITLKADALLVTKGTDRDEHWRDGARMFLTGILTYCRFFMPIEVRSLITVSYLANGLELKLDDLFKALANNDHPDLHVRTIIAQIGGWFDKINVKERGSFISVALRSLAWLNSPIWHDHLRTSDFRPSDLKAGNTTLFIVCPFEKLEQYAPLFRLVITACIVAVLRGPRRCNVSTLFELDEYEATIGRLDILEKSIPYIEGAGGKYLMIFQSMSQLQRLWPDNEHHSIFANSGAQIFFNVSDQLTSEYVSNFAGKYGAMTPGPGGLSYVQRDLLTPDEVRTMPPDDQLIFMRGQRPAWLAKVNLLEHQPFKAMIDSGVLKPNPVHTVQPQLISADLDTSPILSARTSLARAEEKPKLNLPSLFDALEEKYPDKKLRLDGELCGYDEEWRDPKTGLTETIFVPIIHVDLMSKLTKGG